jgi:hypothetical protein
VANTFNGIGTTFYGKRAFEPDDSFVTTKWFVIGFVPIFPMGSLRVRELETTGVPFLSRTTGFDVVEDLPTHWLQVLATYAYAVFIIAWCAYFLGASLAPAAKFLAITAGIVLPHVLRFFAKLASR